VRGLGRAPSLLCNLSARVATKGGIMNISTLDLAGLSVALIAIIGFESLTRLTWMERRGLSGCVQRQRQRWIENMARREQRHIDAILVSSLSQSNAFFASTSVIAIGGLAAVMGAADSAQSMLERLPFVARSPATLWELKILFIIGILVYAFFKFAWAFRLSHYTVIMFGAMPLNMGSEQARDSEAARALHIAQTAQMLGLVGDHANSGLRSCYYALATTAWLFHPVLLMIAIVAVVMILARREFMSRATSIVCGADVG